jgi:tetratricopeptide (TPR) repeat protein
MVNGILKYFLLCCAALLSHSLYSQNEIAHVFGQLKDQNTKKKLEGVTVQVFKDGMVFDTYNAGTTGKYDFKLPLGFTYDIKFSKSGEYLAKVIRIDTRNIPEEDRYGGFDMNVDGTLFPYRQGFNTDLLREPLAKATYNPSEDGLSFDFAYSEQKAKEIDAEFKRLDEIEKNLAKLKADFEKFIKDGDQKMLEKKYADAITNYRGALGVFPDDPTAKTKLADAQAKLDEENANKDLEARYKKLLEEGDAFFEQKKYTEARDRFTKAKDLKNQAYEKEMLHKIDLAVSDGQNRAIYTALIEDADKKFTNKDYAVSIEKYKEASKLYPTESYPKDQILKAESALKDLLANEAERMRLEKEYQDKLALGARSQDEEKLEQAIGHYKAASELKPSEQFPKDKIVELEALIEQRRAQKELDDANAAENAERERIEKEYQEIIAAADGLFTEQKLPEARERYEAALLVKSEAQYPKSKIETIDLLLAQLAQNEANAAQAMADSLAASAEAERLAAEQRLAELLEQERLDQERKRKELEDARLAAEAKLAARKRKWDSNVDVEAEDQVERYYREAAQKEYANKVRVAQQDVLEFVAFFEQKDKDSDVLVSVNRERVKNQFETQSELASIGSSIQSAAIADNERKKKENGGQQGEASKRADGRIRDTKEKVEKKKVEQAAIQQNDRYRKKNVEKNQDLIDRTAKQNEQFERKGSTQTAENAMKIEVTRSKQQSVGDTGEQRRKQKANQVEFVKKEAVIQERDDKQGADQRITNTQLKIDQKKDEAIAFTEGKEIKARENAVDIERQKRDAEYAERQREGKSSNERYEARKEAFEKKAGEPKKEEEYKVIPGTENLKQGVTENSYKLGNKMVTERLVKVGNKVEKYKKVVSKTAIYFFRDGQSISEETWKQATLEEPD